MSADRLAWLNALPEDACRAELERVNGSRRWAAAMAAARPFADAQALHHHADSVWWTLGRADWLEAFSHHPRIGSKDALREKFARTREWASGEQAKVSAADEAVIDGLLRGNDEHDRKYGYIYIVCATGKSAEEMLAILNARLQNDEETELRASALEENRITHIRLNKLLNTEPA